MKASFHIGPIEIYSYGFLIAVGVIAAFYEYEATQENVSVTFAAAGSWVYFIP